MSASALLRVLMCEPLSYRVVRQKGSHRTMVSGTGYPRILFSYHSRTVSGARVRHLLVRQVGLTEAEALHILRR